MHPYEVLHVAPSKSTPGVTYEIRKSHQNGKTYCTCPAWVFKARKGNGICKHIAEYMKTGHVVVLMTMEDYLMAKRPKLVLYDINGNIDRPIEIKRNII